MRRFRLAVLCLSVLQGLCAGAQAEVTDSLNWLSGLHWRSWSSAFAGRSFIGADATTGTPGVTASLAGFTFGTDTLLNPNNLVGMSVTVSRQTFSSGSADGVSDDRALAFYGRHRIFGQAYITEALGYGWHDIDTSRSVRLGSVTLLKAALQAWDAGGRVEAGYGLRLGGNRTLSPYLALVGDAYVTPAYSENAISGSSRFAAAFAASTAGIVHGELGAHYEDSWQLAHGSLSLEFLGAWEHDLNDNPCVLASFLVDPGTTFQARGVRPAIDTALAGAGLRFSTSPRFSVGVRGDTRLGARTTIFSGTLDATFNW